MTNYPSYQAWAILDRKDRINLATTRQTRKESISAFLEITMHEKTWKEIYRCGYRARQISIDVL
jgi:hypothetical protein